MRTLGAIIAGGESRRMGGREKSFLSLGGVSLVARVKSRIQFQVDDVIICANGDAARFAGLDAKVVADDAEAPKSPLAGLQAALNFGKLYGFDAVLTVSSDTPFLPLDLVGRLEREGRTTGAAVAASGGQVHYLCGLWSTALAPVLNRAITGGHLKRVKDWVETCETGQADWPLYPHDPFMNINTPADLAAAEALLRG